MKHFSLFIGLSLLFLFCPDSGQCHKASSGNEISRSVVATAGALTCQDRQHLSFDVIAEESDVDESEDFSFQEEFTLMDGMFRLSPFSDRARHFSGISVLVHFTFSQQALSALRI